MRQTLLSDRNPAMGRQREKEIVMKKNMVMIMVVMMAISAASVFAASAVINDGFVVWQNGESILELPIPEGHTVSKSALRALEIIAPYQLLWEHGKLAGIQGKLLGTIEGEIPMMFDAVSREGVNLQAGDTWPGAGIKVTLWLIPAVR